MNMRMATVVWLCFGPLSLPAQLWAQAQTANDGVVETVPPELQKLDEEYIRQNPPIDDDTIAEYRRNGVAEKELQQIKATPPGWSPQTRPRHIAGQDREARFPMPYYSGSGGINRFGWILHDLPAGTQTTLTEGTKSMWEKFRWLCGPTGAEGEKREFRSNLDKTIGKQKRICLEAAFRDSEKAAHWETETLEYLVDPAILDNPEAQATREKQVHQIARANPTNIGKALDELRALKKMVPDATS